MILLATIKQILANRFDDLTTRIMAWVAVPGGAAAQTAKAATDAVETVHHVNPIVAIAVEWGVVITALAGVMLIIKLYYDIKLARKKLKED